MRALLAVTMALAAPAAQAACPDMRAMAVFAQAVLERRAPAPFRDLAMEDARCAQDRFVAFLAQPWGDVVGHGLRRSGLPAPVPVALFHGTLRAASPARLPARFGAVPMIQPDLLLRVGRDGIEAAGVDHVALLRHLDQAIPFLALPDLSFAPEERPQDIIAGNGGVRLGVVGAPIRVEATAEFARALGAMTVVLTRDGQALARMPADAALGHPLDALAHLVRELARQGRAPRPGALLALGGFAAPVAAAPGGYTLRHDGLPGATPVTVMLE